jgi:hypothetical protein
MNSSLHNVHYLCFRRALLPSIFDKGCISSKIRYASVTQIVALARPQPDLNMWRSQTASSCSALHKKREIVCRARSSQLGGYKLLAFKRSGQGWWSTLRRSENDRVRSAEAHPSLTPCNIAKNTPASRPTGGDGKLLVTTITLYNRRKLSRMRLIRVCRSSYRVG